MATLNYNHLRYFWLVAHAGNLTRAAEKLNLSQSALSVQIQKLEHQLGQPLFDRIGKRLALTEAGRIALDYADSVFTTGDELLSTLKGRPTDRRQSLRVGALTTLSRNFQLEFLKPLMGRSDVDLIVRSGVMKDLLNQLEAHEIDVILANNPAPRDGPMPIRNQVLDEQPVSLVGHRREGQAPFRFPEDLAVEPVLLPSAQSGIRMAFDTLMESYGILPTVLAEIDDMAMLRLIARERRGVALVPPIVVRDELETGVLEEYYRIPKVVETFYAITQNRRFPNPLLATLLDRASGEPSLSDFPGHARTS